jgi:hypothetical protein
MSQKDAQRKRERAAKNRRLKAATQKKAKKVARVSARHKRDEKK